MMAMKEQCKTMRKRGGNEVRFYNRLRYNPQNHLVPYGSLWVMYGDLKKKTDQITAWQIPWLSGRHHTSPLASGPSYSALCPGALMCLRACQSLWSGTFILNNSQINFKHLHYSTQLIMFRNNVWFQAPGHVIMRTGVHTSLCSTVTPYF